MRQLVGILEAMHLKTSVTHVKLGCFCQKTILRHMPASNCDDIDCPKTNPGPWSSGICLRPCGDSSALSPFILNMILGLPSLKFVQLTLCRRQKVASIELSPLSPPSPCNSVDVGTSLGPLPFQMLIHPENICWR